MLNLILYIYMALILASQESHDRKQFSFPYNALKSVNLSTYKFYLYINIEFDIMFI